MRPHEIVKMLRRRITSGEFPPGATLPLRHELLEEYGISVATFQKCVNQLTREGFLESRGIKGTVVPSYPPHLYHYALVFPEAPGCNDVTDTFFPALRSSGEAFEEQNPGVRMRHYFVGNAGSHTGKELEQLIEDAQNNLLAGILFVNFAPEPDVQKEFQACPCVVISRRSSDSYHNYPSLEFDSEALLAQCIQAFHRKGRRRIAVLVSQNISTERAIRMQKQLDPAHPEWLLGIDHIHGRALLNKNLLKLLFRLPQKERPDALAVLNENFMPLVMESLLELGLEPGRDVALAAHCNFPTTAKRYPDTEYFAYSALDVLQNAVALLKSAKNKIVMIRPKPLTELLKQ